MQKTACSCGRGNQLTKHDFPETFQLLDHAGKGTGKHPYKEEKRIGGGFTIIQDRTKSYKKDEPCSAKSKGPPKRKKRSKESARK